MDLFWIILSVILALISLGLSGIVKLGFVTVSFMLGGIVVLLGIAFSARFSALTESIYKSKQTVVRSAKHVTVADAHLTDPDTSGGGSHPGNMSLSGNDVIDAPLNDIVSYVFRDYVYPWHFKLTHSKAFPVHLLDTVQVAIAKLSNRIRDVDWIPFLTTRYVKLCLYG